MTDKIRCTLCNNTEEDMLEKGLAHTVVRSPVTGNIVCSTCVKGIYDALMFTEKLMEEAITESMALVLKGEKRNEDGECNCPKHIFERKREAALKSGGKEAKLAKMVAEEVKEVDSLPATPTGATVH